VPKDRFYRERERHIREAIISSRLGNKHYYLGSEAIPLKSLQREIGPRRVSCSCGLDIEVSVREQKDRSIISCPKCGKRYRASLHFIDPIAGSN
jgi:hypothetical protein